MLWGDDGLDDAGDVVDVRKRFYAKNHVVESTLGDVRGFLGDADNCRRGWLADQSVSGRLDRQRVP